MTKVFRVKNWELVFFCNLPRNETKNTLRVSTKSINFGKIIILTARFFSRLGIYLYYNIILMCLLFSGIKISKIK